jgi:indole-3-glycerol phosphate synthase
VTVLSSILERKYAEVADRRVDRPEVELEEVVNKLSLPKSLFAVLSPQGGMVRVIAEIKRASPSAGTIDPKVDAAALAARYAQSGATAVSVLTDAPGFGGSLDDLRMVRATVSLPLLRKDFVVDRYQLLEAREAGADAVLLIAAALEGNQLETLLSAAQDLAMDALVEVHDQTELQQALDAGAQIIGVNNRDLKTFEVDLSTSEKLLPLIPSKLRGVAESGIRGAGEARRLRAAGGANFLVGEALVRATDPAALVRELLAVP